MNPVSQLILASGSPYRRDLLGRLGHPFSCVSPDADETRQPHEMPAALAERLARVKAQLVASRHPDAFVIGSDQVIALGEEVLSKPGTPDAARAQLARLQGRQHELITAVCVVSPTGMAEERSVHTMKMRALTPEEIDRYVTQDSPLDCAGSYRIEAHGIGLFEFLRGDDYTGIVGLPLTVVRRLLDELGFSWGER